MSSSTANNSFPGGYESRPRVPKSTPAWAVGDQRVPFPKWYIPVFFCVVVGAVALPQGTARLFSTLPIVLALLSMLPYHTEGSFKKDFDFGNLIFGWFLVYLSLILTAPEKQFWKKDDRNLTPEERSKEVESKGFLQKLPWSFNLYTNPRGIGWSNQASGLRQASTVYPVWKFVVQKLGEALAFTITIDLLNIWYKSLQNQSADWTLFSEPTYMRILIGLSNLVRIYVEMASMHSLSAAFTTAFGIYKPSDWPSIVGRLSDAYTVKRFWSLVWHQFMRQIAHPGGLLLSRDILGLPKGSFLGQFMYLVGGFAAPGIYHTMVAVFATGFRGGWNPCGDLQCFLLQAVAIVVEGYAVALVKRSGHASNTSGWKLFGYIWCACWLGYSSIWYVDGLMRAGLWDVDLRVLQFVPNIALE